jgi:hypothetical protein
MGGAGGHMRHPHDLNEVDNGKDIIALFRAIPDYLKSKEFAGGETSSLKLDGSNNGLRLVYRDGRYQFAIDRGTKGEMDAQGVTTDQLEDRFKSKIVIDPETGQETTKQHGMVASSNLLLNMMNGPLEHDRDEMFSILKDLGFLVESDGRLMPDSSKYISIEYVERKAFDHPTNPKLGRANVIYYPFDFIAFHGVSEFFEMVLKKTGAVVRAGPKPTVEDSGPGKPIPYDRTAMAKLVEIVTPYAPEGFRVFGPVSLKVAVAAGEEGQESDVEGALGQLSQNIDAALNTNISIRTSADSSEPPLTMTLEEWLNKAKNFNYQPNIRLTNGKKVSPFHKSIHQALLVDGISVPELVEDPEIGQGQCDLSGNLYDCEKAIYGAIFMEAARILGNTVKESLMPSVEEFGPAVSHEGIVIDAGMPFGKKRTGHAFKITGEFIVDASGGAYATSGPDPLKEDEEEDPYIDVEILDDEDIDPVVDSDFSEKTVAIIPGAFKPPHKGHAKMVEKYLADGADRVIILVSQPLKSSRPIPGLRDTGMSIDDSIGIWNMLVGGWSGVEVEKSPHATPISAAYALVADEPARTKEAQDAGIEPIRKGDTIILGASAKEDSNGRADWERWTGAEKYVAGDLNLIPPSQSAVEPVEHSAEYMGLLNISPLKNDMPSVKAGKNPREFHASDMRYLLEMAGSNGEAIELLEDFVGESEIFGLLKIFGLGADLEEISAVGGGAVVGFAGPSDREEDSNEPNIIRQENIDLNIIDDVIRLIMEKGIMR